MSELKFQKELTRIIAIWRNVNYISQKLPICIVRPAVRSVTDLKIIEQLELRKLCCLTMFSIRFRHNRSFEPKFKDMKNTL